MFSIIEPKDYLFNKSLVDPLLEVIKCHSSLSSNFENHKDATFLVVKDEPRGIYAGALLIKKSLASLYKTVGKNIHKLAFHNENVWTCTLSIQMAENEASPRYEYFCKNFYRNLYEKLLEFGIKEKVDFLWVTLEPVEHLSTELIGSWAYDAKVSPKHSLDGLFHGILPLTRSQLHYFPKSSEEFTGFFSEQLHEKSIFPVLQ